MKEKLIQIYDPRWFVWTIVFLVATGMALVSYIVIGGNNEAAQYQDFRVNTKHNASAAK